MSPNGPVAEIISRYDTDKEKYISMAKLVDGDLVSPITCTLELDDFSSLLTRMQVVGKHLVTLSLHSPFECKLCTTLQGESVSHGMTGCSQQFNVCHKCFGLHPSKDCTGPLFKLPSGYCWKCWLPLFPILGISFHPREKDQIGNVCKQSAINFLKPLCARNYYQRVSGMEGNSGSLKEYEAWLFHQSDTAGLGQVPNLILLIEAAFRKQK
jgi:hypothetical protein